MQWRSLFSGFVVLRKWQRTGIVMVASLAVIGAIVQLVWLLQERHRQHMAQVMKNPPWMMWGNSQVISVAIGPTAPATTSGQLVKISYARPENWKFLFGATVIEAPHVPGVCQVAFSVTTGVGRAILTIERFEFYFFDETAGFLDNLVGRPFYTTQVQDTGRGVTAPYNTTGFITEIPGQDIQVQGQVSCIVAQAGTWRNLVMTVDAHFAPSVHIRPEWYKGEFAAGEDEAK